MNSYKIEPMIIYELERGRSPEFFRATRKKMSVYDDDDPFIL